MKIEEKYLHLRSMAAAYLAGRQMFNTLALISCCDQRIEEIPAPAGVTNQNELAMYVHPKTVEFGLEHLDAYVFIVSHEMFHLVQLDNLGDVVKIVSLAPLKEVYEKKMKAATNEEAKAGWHKSLIALEDLTPTGYGGKIIRSASNIGMDAAINTIVEKLIPGGLQKIDDFLVKEFKKKDDKNFIGAVTPAKLSTLFEEELKPDYEWLYYAQKYIDWMAKEKDAQDPNDPPQVIEVLVGFDEHDFAQSGEEEQMGKQRVREAVEKAAAEAKIMAHSAGKTASDLGMEVTSQKMSEALKKVLSDIKLKFSIAHKDSNEEEYRYEKANKIWPDHDLPGGVYVDKPTPAVVLVLDTSGSMWSKPLMEQMVSIATMYHKKKQLHGFYCCDTELHKVELERGSSCKVRGGGGTVFSVEQIDSILKDLKNPKKRVDVIYATDEEVHGLEEAKKDKRTRLHVVNIPDILRAR